MVPDWKIKTTLFFAFPKSPSDIFISTYLFFMFSFQFKFAIFYFLCNFLSVHSEREKSEMIKPKVFWCFQEVLERNGLKNLA